MIRTYIACVFVSLILVGCSFDFNKGTDNTPEPTVESTRVSVNTLKIGDICGVDDTKICVSGSSCQYDANEQGRCQAKDVDPNVTCTKEKAPVCGRKGRGLLGYLNECEAKRHNAQIINEGFCAPTDISNDCGETVSSIGNCSDRFEGFEFNAGTGSCDLVVIRGCELQAPFTNAETCSNTCGS